MERVVIKTDYIKLDQFLKYTGVCDRGSDAKYLISEGRVKVNGEKELRREKKLRKGDTIEVEGEKFVVDRLE